jgi:hypothetical protein
MNKIDVYDGYNKKTLYCIRKRFFVNIWFKIGKYKLNILTSDYLIKMIKKLKN